MRTWTVVGVVGVGVVVLGVASFTWRRVASVMKGSPQLSLANGVISIEVPQAPIENVTVTVNDLYTYTCGTILPGTTQIRLELLRTPDRRSSCDTQRVKTLRLEGWRRGRVVRAMIQVNEAGERTAELHEIGVIGTQNGPGAASATSERPETGHH